MFSQAEIEQLLAMMSRLCPEALLLLDEVVVRRAPSFAEVGDVGVG